MKLKREESEDDGDIHIIINVIIFRLFFFIVIFISRFIFQHHNHHRRRHPFNQQRPNSFNFPTVLQSMVNGHARVSGPVDVHGNKQQHLYLNPPCKENVKELVESVGEPLG